MRIFALQTDRDKIVQRFCHEGECVILMSYYHIFYFILPILKEIVFSAIIVTGMITGIVLGWHLGWTIGISTAIFIGLVLLPVIKAYIDWNYDFILVTTDKVILVDQTSIFRQEIKPIHIENIGSVSTETQFWDIFNFGQICLHLKEGEGGDKIVRPFVPNAKEIASKISDVVTRYQRGMFTPATPSHRGRKPFPGQKQTATQHAQAAQQAFQNVSAPTPPPPPQAPTAQSPASAPDTVQSQPASQDIPKQ